MSITYPDYVERHLTAIINHAMGSDSLWEMRVAMRKIAELLSIDIWEPKETAAKMTSEVTHE